MEKGISLFVSSCDEQVGYTFCMALLTGPGRQCVDQLYCGALNPERDLVHELEEKGGKILAYHPDQPTEDLLKLLRSIDAILLIPPHRVYTKDSQRHSSVGLFEVVHAWQFLVQVTAQAGPRWVTMMSVVGIDQLTELHRVNPARWRRVVLYQKLETIFRQAAPHDPAKKRDSFPWCIIRKSLPMDNLFLYQEVIRTDRRLPLPIAKGNFSPVSMMDVAIGYLTLLRTSMSPLNSILNTSPDKASTTTQVAHFTGTELVGGRRIAEYGSQVFDVQLTYAPWSPARVRAHLEKFSRLTPEEVEYLLQVYDMISENLMDRKSDTLSELLGHPPTTVGQFLQSHETSFRPRV
ncbi:hypothetical protein IWQ62_001147 [Dispira parvispora]|uniref:Uncharacterized protein n=1 Tax=Dispira parvispora TaxID=1520584 RepID=A0A9W8AT47_9FUNG|nr:hypothetical protein IWQ62_001147 [Dispira parvispora]